MMKSLKSVVFGLTLVAGSLMFASASKAGPNDGPAAAPLVGVPDQGQAQLFAVVRADGSIARTGGANPATTGKIPGFTGAYKVGFFRNVRGCAYIATIGGSSNVGVPAPGQIVTEGRV